MRDVAINCYSYIWKMSAHDAIDHLAGLGYHELEFMVNWPHLWPSALGPQARRLTRQSLERNGTRIISLAPPMLDLNLVSPAPEMRRYTINHYIDVIRLAGEWGAPWVVVVQGKTHPLLPLPDDYRDSWFDNALVELERCATAEGVEITLENVPNSFLPRADDLMSRLAKIGIDHIGITYDVANAVFFGEDPSQGLVTVEPRLRFVHLSDTGTSAWAHSAVGSGMVPFQSIGAALDRIGFLGPTSLEIISADPDEDIRKSHVALSAWGWKPTDQY
jgi:sugar phosphate isomerase/epimerase